MSSPWFFVRHILLWFWPFDRLFILGSYRWGEVDAWKLAACWVVLLLAASWCLTRIRRDSVPKYCLLFFLVGFAPTGNCLGFMNGPFGDYYMGLASVGLAAWVADQSFSFADQTGKRRISGCALAAALVASRAWGVTETASWAVAWGAGTEVVAASVRNHPEFFPNKTVWAATIFGKDRYEQALRLCREVEEAVEPNSKHLATVFALRGAYEMEVNHDADEALRLFNGIPRVDPSEDAKKQWHFNRGRVFESIRKDADSAEREYRAAVIGKNPHLDAANRLAILETRFGRQNEAIELWERILRIKPDDETALWHLSMAYRASGDKERAEKLEARALKAGGR